MEETEPKKKVVPKAKQKAMPLPPIESDQKKTAILKLVSPELQSIALDLLADSTLANNTIMVYELDSLVREITRMSKKSLHAKFAQLIKEIEKDRPEGDDEPIKFKIIKKINKLCILVYLYHKRTNPIP
jgi:hypothetical protein